MNSPFRYRQGTVQEEAVEKTINMSDMNQFIKNEALNEVDLKVLSSIHSYRYLTAGIIDQLYKNESFYGMRFAKKRMRKFREYGLVRRFYITFDVPGELQERTVNFYALTDAAMKYLKKYRGLQSYTIPEAHSINVGDILGTLSINQMLVNYFTKGLAVIDETAKSNEIRERCLILSDGTPINILSVRGDQRMDELLRRIELANKRRSTSYLLVEDEVAATEIYKAIYSKTNAELYFITDYMMVSEDMYSSYLKVIRQESNYTINEFRLING